MIQRVNLVLNYTTGKSTQKEFDKRSDQALTEMDEFLNDGYEILFREQFHTTIGIQLCIVLWKANEENEP